MTLQMQRQGSDKYRDYRDKNASEYKTNVDSDDYRYSGNSSSNSSPNKHKNQQ